jgi:hypothetical protein
MGDPELLAVGADFVTVSSYCVPSNKAVVRRLSLAGFCVRYVMSRYLLVCAPWRPVPAYFSAGRGFRV